MPSLRGLLLWVASKMENRLAPKPYAALVSAIGKPGSPFNMYSLRSLDLISSGAAETGEVLAVMAKLGVDKTHDDVCQAWYNEWNAMAVSLEKRAKDAEAAGHKVTAASCYLRATEYHRQSFFFLRDNLDDPRIAEASKAVQTCFQAYIRLSGAPLQTVAIPYDDAKTLDGYFAPGKGSKPGEKRPVAVIVGDYDGCAEEHWLTTGRFAWERGYHVLVFDGPGQGSSLWQKDIYFPEAVETSVDAAAAFLAASKPEADLSKVILLGRKYGGYLAMHTAGAVAKRGSGPYTIAAVAVAPLYMNMGERTNPQILMTPQLKAAFAEGNEEYVNTELKSLMSQLCTVRFSLKSRAGCHGMADNPYAWLRRYQDVLVCEDMVTGIKCPVWVGIHTDKAWNHQVLDKPFDKIEDLTVGKFSFNEDGTLGVYWECGGASTMCTIMDFVEDKVAI